MTINPIDFEELYNSIFLGNVKSPGTVTLSGHDRKANWDVKSGPGLSGATTTLKDVPPIEFTASFYLATKDQFEEWQAFVPLIESTISGKKPKAVDIYHPDLASQNPPIASVCKALVAGIVHDGKGGQTVSVKFQEYRLPKAAGGTPKGSTSKPKKADPDAALLAEISALTTQYQATPWSR
jgi:hypothetical protein